MTSKDDQAFRKKVDEEGWYTKEIKTLEPTARKLFESYSGIVPGEVIPHIEKVGR